MSSPSNGSLCLQVAAIIAAAVIAQRQADHDTDEADMSLAYSGGSGRVSLSLQRLICIADGALVFMHPKHPRSATFAKDVPTKRASTVLAVCMSTSGTQSRLRAPDVVSAVSRSSEPSWPRKALQCCALEPRC